MSLRVTQAGITVWVQNTSNARATQAGVTAWVTDPTHARVTQVGITVWRQGTNITPSAGVFRKTLSGTGGRIGTRPFIRWGR